MEHIGNSSEQEYPCRILTDLEKQFDAIDQEVLLKTSMHYGVIKSNVSSKTWTYHANII